MGDRTVHVDKRYDGYRQEVHLKKVQSMRPAINNAEPKSYSHLTSQRKRIQNESGTVSSLRLDLPLPFVIVSKLAENIG